MTATQHFTTATTWATPANITQARARAAGECGDLLSGSYYGGLGAVIDGIIPVSGTVTVGVGSIPGGVHAYRGGDGGRGTVVGSVVAGGGGARGRTYTSWDTVEQPGAAGGNAALPGAVAQDGGQDYWSSSTQTRGRGAPADGSGGAGGTSLTSGYPAGNAGQSNVSGGAGGNGVRPGSNSLTDGEGGAGGGGFGGGGSGAVDKVTSVPGVTGYASAGGGGGGGGSTGGVFVQWNAGAPYADLTWASVPAAPTLLGPTSGPINRAAAQTFSWRHNGATSDVLDGQSGFDLQYRLIGAGSWTAVPKQVTANRSYVFATSTFAAGDYEWQVRTYADGLVGPWSTSSYFTAADLPAAPTITAPAAAVTIPTASIPVMWTVAAEVAWQAQVISGTQTLADSGQVAGTGLSTTLTTTVNHVSATVQVRVQATSGGLWSDWSTVAVTIEWAPPPTPTVILATDTSSIRVSIVNPAPTGLQPTADRIDLYVTEGGVSTRRATLAPGDGWTYWVPPSDTDIGFEAVAIYTPTGVQASSGVVW